MSEEIPLPNGHKPKLKPNGGAKSPSYFSQEGIGDPKANLMLSSFLVHEVKWLGKEPNWGIKCYGLKFKGRTTSRAFWDTYLTNHVIVTYVGLKFLDWTPICEWYVYGKACC